MNVTRALSLVTTPVLAGLIVAGCHGGSGSHHSGTTLDLSGSWQGDWTGTEPLPGGDVSLSLSQEGAAVVGSVDFSAWACFDMGTVECQVMGNMIYGSFSDGATLINFSASCSGPGNGMMDGSYEIMSNGSCFGDMGSFHMTRASSASAPPPPEKDAVWALSVRLLDPEDDNAEGKPVMGYEARALLVGEDGAPVLEMIEIAVPLD